MRTRLRTIVVYAISNFILLTGFVFSASAQAPAQKAKRATAAQINSLITANPDLSSGFTTPGNAKAKVQRKVPGGIVFAVTSPRGVTGTVTVVGPPTVMERDWIGTIIDIAGKLWDKFGGGGSSGGGGGGCTTTTTVTTTTEGGKSTTTTTSTTTCTAG
jgi:hypothetical protein